MYRFFAFKRPEFGKLLPSLNPESFCLIFCLAVRALLDSYHMRRDNDLLPMSRQNYIF